MSQKNIRPEYHALVREDINPLMERSDGKLLDVGGGIGGTASKLKKDGFVSKAGVIDIIDYKDQDLDLDFRYTGNLENPEVIKNIVEKEGQFSIILCLDVLEHLSNPWLVVENLTKSLAPGGIIIASLPNIRYYKASFPLFFRGKWELEESGIRDRTHLRWFVRKTAIELMTSSGLLLEEVISKPGGGRKIKLIRGATFGLFNEFTNLQYLIRVRKK